MLLLTRAVGFPSSTRRYWKRSAPRSNRQVIASSARTWRLAGMVIVSSASSILIPHSSLVSRSRLVSATQRIKASRSASVPVPGFLFVFESDNLSFRSELLVKRRHTRFGEVRFHNAIAGAVTQLQGFQEVERHRIHWLQNTQVSEERASHLVVQAMDQGIVSAPVIPRIWREIKEPSFEYGGIAGLTLWGILQAFTTCLGERARRSPNEYCGMTVRLNALFSPPEPPSHPQVQQAA